MATRDIDMLKVRVKVELLKDVPDQAEIDRLEKRIRSIESAERKAEAKASQNAVVVSGVYLRPDTRTKANVPRYVKTMDADGTAVRSPFVSGGLPGLGKRR